MDTSFRDRIFEAVQIGLDQEQFFSSVFSAVEQERVSVISGHRRYYHVIADVHLGLTKEVSVGGLQEACSYRNLCLARDLADMLIDDEGTFDLVLLERCIQNLQSNLYILGPEYQHDGARRRHVLRILKAFLKCKELRNLLYGLGVPDKNRLALDLIRTFLRKGKNSAISVVEVRRTVLSACLNYLRQTVGSCFATAPAILIHEQQVELFLKDVSQMLATGQLSRTYGGVQYAVPMSRSWGVGDLRKPQLLRTDDGSGTQAFLSSPALKQALDEVGVDDPRSALQDYLRSKEYPGVFVYLSAEELIRGILLQKHKISSEDLEIAEAYRPSLAASGLMVRSQSEGGLEGRYRLWKADYERARAIFRLWVDHPLLKAWEYTLASFAETKIQFAKWNLFASLGFDPEQKGGIGDQLYRIISDLLDRANRDVQVHQEEYERIYHHIQHLENKYRRSNSEQEARYTRGEWHSRKAEMDGILERRDSAHRRAQVLANLFNDLLSYYEEKFQDYFQEVYDADLREVEVGPYDDSPAGFRLLYKFGLSNTSQWHFIHTSNEFVEALVQFFTSVELDLQSRETFQGFSRELADITTALVNHVRTNEFMETAFHRMALSHSIPVVKNPLENISNLKVKPWVYTSGGTMNTLVSAYYSRESHPHSVQRWVEDPKELLVFLIDTIKELPERWKQHFRDDPDQSMLMHSPTHAFLLKPGAGDFRQAWEGDEYTHTWVRDMFIAKHKRFLDSILLSREEMMFLVEHLSCKLPDDLKDTVRFVFRNPPSRLSIKQFRTYIMDGLRLQAANRMDVEQSSIDGALRQALPLVPRHRLKDRLESLLLKLRGKLNVERMIEGVERKLTYGGFPFITAQQLQNICLALISIEKASLTSDTDYHLQVSQAASALGFAMPTPLFFADSNWNKDYFAFLVNPSTEELELWRLDACGREGAPMDQWKCWLDGSRQRPEWCIFNRPQEYWY